MPVEVMESSLLCRRLIPVWLHLCGYYEHCLLARVIRGIARAWNGACRGSVLLHIFLREGALSKAWPGSALCRGLTLILSLPGLILQSLYRSLQAAFEDSFAARMAFNVAEELPLFAAWLMLGIMIIPYEHWNNAYSFAGFVLLFGLSWVSGMRRRRFLLNLADLGPWLVLFAGAILAAWPLSSYPGLSKRFLLYYGTCLLCLIVVVSTVRTWQHLLRYLWSASLALLVMACYGIYQRIQGVEVNVLYVDLSVNEDMPGRIWGFYDNPNAFGEVLLMLIPLAVAYLLCSRTWSGRALGCLGAGTGCVAMAMTYSRASWLGLALAAVVFLVLWNRKLIPVGIVAACLVLGLLPNTIFHRLLTIFNSSDSSTTSRFPLYYAAARLLADHPILGAGLGSDALRKAIAAGQYYTGKDTFVHCHNIYLQVWCETGLVGLVAFVGGIIWTIKQSCRAVASGLGHPTLKMTAIGASAALCGTMLCGLADYIWNYPRVMLIFWFVCALALAAVRLARLEGKKRQDAAPATTGSDA